MCQIQSKELLEAFQVYLLKYFLPREAIPEYNLEAHASNLLRMVREYRDHSNVSLERVQRLQTKIETLTKLTDQEKHELGIPI